MASGVYIIKNKIDNRTYIGSSVDTDRRRRQHKHRLLSGTHFNRELQAFVNMYGYDSLVFEMLEATTDLIAREQFYLDTMQPAFNICYRADSHKGVKRTEETKRKCAIAKMGRRFSHTEETKRKIGLGNKGHTHNEATRHKISLSKKGQIYKMLNTIQDGY